ncbi:hypothetical protein Y032_0015g2521 [Ancylostoma ceylanicum]|uniref:Uncharacterized protein n=1 Tax=Ancylostoma ceylanicum TaxID=53326 RepID=A0A016V903_9BILA|nr:hypothetical protein Y032_0015g2521 [Ancylostoma ceylanicum]
MPFIQNRSAFLQSQSHDGRTDLGDGDERYFSGPPQSAEPSSSGLRHSGYPTPPMSTAASEDPLAGALLGIAEENAIFKEKAKVAYKMMLIFAISTSIIPFVQNLSEFHKVPYLGLPYRNPTKMGLRFWVREGGIVPA